MTDKAEQLAQRRRHLIAQAASQRTTLARQIEPWRQPLAHLDQGLAALRYLKRHPFLVAGGVALFAALRPGRAGLWLRRGWLAWRLVQGLRPRR